MLIQGLSKETGKTQDIELAANGSMYVIPTGSNLIIHDGIASWANSAAANTAVNIDVSLPGTIRRDAIYLLTVTNPSAITALTVSVKVKETLGGSAKYPELARYGVAADLANGRSVIIQGLALGEGGRISISNDTVLGASDGFMAYVRIREI